MKYFILALITCFLMTATPLQAQYAVRDKTHDKWSKVLLKVQQVSLFLKAKITLFTENVKNVQEFFQKAVSIVNGVVKNLRLIKRLIEIEKEITELTQRSINAINTPIDADGDGVDDLDFADKWRHIQIILAISSQASNVFDLFKNVVEDDSTIMDDKGRLTLIKDAYKEAVKIKSAIKVQLRRINKEVYLYQRNRKEIQTFTKLFSTQ